LSWLSRKWSVMSAGPAPSVEAIPADGAAEAGVDSGPRQRQRRRTEPPDTATTSGA
jgi:hypothetical protein